jgi:methionyl-tRNA synthetase
MLTKYYKGKIGELPHHSHDTTGYDEAISQLRFDRALEVVWSLVRGLNQYLEEEQPWQKAKDDPQGLDEVLHHAVADLEQIAILLLPFMPVTAEKIIATFAGGMVHPEVGVLFPKAEAIEKTTFEVN